MRVTETRRTEGRILRKQKMDGVLYVHSRKGWREGYRNVVETERGGKLERRKQLGSNISDTRPGSRDLAIK